MAEGSLNKQQALATIQAGRRDLTAEAEWLRNAMSPKRIASNIAHEHTVALVACAFVIGVGVSWMLDRKLIHRPPKVERPKDMDHGGNGSSSKAPPAAKVAAGAYLAGLLLKSATPALIKGGLRFLNNLNAFPLRRTSR